MLATDFHLSFGSRHGPGQPVHLGLEQVERHGTGIVRSHQGCPFLAELLQAAVGALGLAMGLGAFAGQFGLHAEPDAVRRLGWQLKALAQLQDTILDPLDADSPSHAADLLMVPLGADEVVEGATMAPGGRRRATLG